jgi:hypothetical protein
MTQACQKSHQLQKAELYEELQMNHSYLLHDNTTRQQKIKYIYMPRRRLCGVGQAVASQ